MGFFDALLAGAATGIGKGMIDQADYNDKLAAQQELLKEKHANALQLQSQRADDKLFQAQTLAALKGGGSGGGGSVDVFSRLRGANPEEQRMALGEIRALGGDDAANLAEEAILGRAPMRQRPADFVGLPGQTDIGPDAKVTERVEYDKMKGQQALNRVYALIAGKGDTKGNAQGEDQYMSNDLRAAGLEQALRGGKPLAEASAYASQVSDPATYDKNKTNAERVAATVENTDLKRELAEVKRASDAALAGNRSVNDIEDLIFKNKKLLAENRGADKDGSITATIQRLQARLNAVTAASSPGTVTVTPSAPRQTGSAAPKLQDSLARFSAMRQGQAAR